MKILVLSNFYPPHHIGGYGMLCLEVVDALMERGHDVTVLTSTHGVKDRISQGHVHRWLTLESDLYFYQPSQAITYPLVRKRNLAYLRRMVNDINPDIIFIWGMWSLSKQVAKEAERLLGNRVVYYLANPWPIEPNMHQAYWDDPANRPLRQVFKQALRLPMRAWLKSEWQKVPLAFEHAPSCSKALKDQLIDANIPLKDGPIIYEGIDLEPYMAQAKKRNGVLIRGEVLSLIFVGTLAEHKGVHTTIEAIHFMEPAYRAKVHLTILGSGHPHYEAQLRQLVQKYQLAEQVQFHQPIPRTNLPEFLGRFEVLLLPSTWEEPLARIMQEGLAAGMVVIGSMTGGTKEIIINEENGLTFEPEDAETLAKQIKLLIDNPDLRQRLGVAGYKTAEEKFALPRMVDEIETYLQRCLAVDEPVSQLQL